MIFFELEDIYFRQTSDIQEEKRHFKSYKIPFPKVLQSLAKIRSQIILQSPKDWFPRFLFMGLIGKMAYFNDVSCAQLIEALDELEFLEGALGMWVYNKLQFAESAYAYCRLSEDILGSTGHLILPPIRWTMPTRHQLSHFEFHEYEIQKHFQYEKDPEEVFRYVDSTLIMDANALDKENRTRFDVASLSELVQKTVSYGSPKQPIKLIQAILNEELIPLPVVVYNEGKYILGGGATRVMIANLAGQTFQALIVDVAKKNRSASAIAKKLIDEDELAFHLFLFQENEEAMLEILQLIQQHGRDPSKVWLMYKHFQLAYPEYAKLTNWEMRKKILDLVERLK